MIALAEFTSVLDPLPLPLLIFRLSFQASNIPSWTPRPVHIFFYIATTTMRCFPMMENDKYCWCYSMATRCFHYGYDKEKFTKQLHISVLLEHKIKVVITAAHTRTSLSWPNRSKEQTDFFYNIKMIEEEWSTAHLCCDCWRFLRLELHVFLLISWEVAAKVWKANSEVLDLEVWGFHVEGKICGIRDTYVLQVVSLY